MPPLEPSLGLGTSGLDDPTECRTTVTTALEARYRHVDTARMCDNEAAVGEGIAAADELERGGRRIDPDDAAWNR